MVQHVEQLRMCRLFDFQQQMHEGSFVGSTVTNGRSPPRNLNRNSLLANRSPFFLLRKRAEGAKPEVLADGSLQLEMVGQPVEETLLAIRTTAAC